MTTEPRRINSHPDLVQLAADLGVRPDWHEPDEQGVSAYLVGDHLDNAMGSGIEHSFGEFQVVITRERFREVLAIEPEAVAVVNLATLLAWAAAPIEATWQERGTAGRIALVAGNGLLLDDSRRTRYGTRENLRHAISAAERERKAARRG